MAYYILAAILVVIDQIVKVWVRANIALGENLDFIPGFMELTFVKNTGAAFSSFSGMTWLLALISLAATVLVAVLLAKNYFPGTLGKFTLSLILAGAAGNLIDRVLLGYVTDMFQTILHPFENFAVYNVADICVVVGGILMVIYVLFFWDREKAREDGRSPEERA